MITININIDGNGKVITSNTEKSQVISTSSDAIDPITAGYGDDDKSATPSPVQSNAAFSFASSDANLPQPDDYQAAGLSSSAELPSPEDSGASLSAANDDNIPQPEEQVSKAKASTPKTRTRSTKRKSGSK